MLYYHGTPLPSCRLGCIMYSERYAQSVQNSCSSFNQNICPHPCLTSGECCRRVTLDT